jgi:hypothetical protein
MLCHSGNTFKLAITKIIFNLVKPLLRNIEKTMVISDLEHLESCESSGIIGGFLDLGWNVEIRVPVTVRQASALYSRRRWEL